MPVAHSTESCGTTATQLYQAPQSGANVIVRAPAGITDNVYLGGPGVTTADYGVRLAPDEESPLLPLPPGDIVYGVTDGAAAVSVQVLAIER